MFTVGHKTSISPHPIMMATAATVPALKEVCIDFKESHSDLALSLADIQYMLEAE